MNQLELKNILSAKFDFSQWKSLLQAIFGSNVTYFTKEATIDASLIKSGGQVGTIHLDDSRSLAIFKFEVSDSVQIARNRKSLRDIAAKYVDQSLIHGAWVFYYSEKQDDYRLTYIAKQTSFSEEGELITKETAPKRYTFLLGKNESCTTAANRLLELFNKNKTISLADVTEVFSVERLNKEFFAGYKAQYTKFLGQLTDTKPNRDYVKKLLGRLVFLQFLQKKGWLGVPAHNESWEGGDKNYLANLIDRYSNNDRLLSDVLEPLFFETLNEARDNDIANPILGENIRIPYLNGGLFDKDRLDQMDIDFPYSYFKGLMDFFSMYNFTIDENDPEDSEVGIDPEMLGHIFENLLEDNKDKGAFYTPKEIVQYMCRESVVQYLTTNTDNSLHEAIQLLIKTRKVADVLQEKTIARQIYDLLRKMKVCDPAIGSGAFPMGVLNVLYHSRQLLYGFIQGKETFCPATVKREIIQDNIYGVDIEQGAVDIARLRFWLALVVDEIEPQPLPNLDYKIVCGNSLLNRHALDISIDTVFAEYSRKNKTPFTLSDFQRLVADYTNTSDHTLKEQFKEKISEIKRAFKTVLNDSILLKRGKIENQVLMLESDTLFGPPTKESLKEAKGLRKKYAKLLNTKESIKGDELYRNAFEWRFEFPDLLDNEGRFTGFDLVIGNPPYLRIQGIRDTDSAFADELVNKYKSATGSFDLYALFAERGLQIINNQGVVNYIMPVKWTNAAFGKGLRSVVADNNSACKIISFGAYQVFNASTYTGLQWFKPNSKEMLYYELDRNLETNQELGQYLYSLNIANAAKIDANKLKTDAWVLTVGKTTVLLNRLEEQPRRISDIFDRIFCGLQTSKDDVYFLYKCRIEGTMVVGYSKYLKREVIIERGLVKPLLKGEDVHRYDNISTDRFVIFPYILADGKANLYTEKLLAEQFPQGYDYLKECEDVLRGREKGRFNISGEWFQYGRKQGILSAETEKLVAPDISLGGNFAYDVNGEFYSTTTVYGYIKKSIVKEGYKCLVAILNSRLCWWFLVNTGTTLANGYFRFKPDYIHPFPVPAEISDEVENV
ncbi:MAG: Eco57I restriction-modification methylase domain-containing protein, partial [Phocaeicola sp.]